MKLKIKIAGLTVVSLLIGILYFSFQKERKERIRLEGNQNSFIMKIEHYKTSDSLNAATVGRLQLTSKELKAYNSELAKEVETLKISNRRLLSVSQTAIVTTTPIYTTLTDSIIIKDTIIQKVKCIDWSDGFTTINGCITGQEFAGKIENRVKIIQALHRVPKHKIWFLKFGTKGVQQEIKTTNPNSFIEAAEYIEIAR